MLAASSSHSSYATGRFAKAPDTDVAPEKIDVARYLDDMEHTLRYGSDAIVRNEALAILRRWQFDSMLTDDSCSRAALLLREFGDVSPASKPVS